MKFQSVVIGFILICFFSGVSWGTELSLEYDPEKFRGRSVDIIPDKSAYGVAFGSSEKELISAFGKPIGEILINESKKILVYGQSHFFIIKRGRFKGLMVGEHLFYFKALRQMDEHPFFDRHLWILQPGVKKDMGFSQALKALGKKWARSDYRYIYEGDVSTTELTFSSSWVESSKEKNYRLNGFSIKNYSK